MSNWNYDDNYGPGPPEQQIYETNVSIPNATFYNRAHEACRNENILSFHPSTAMGSGSGNGNSEVSSALPAVDISQSKLTATAKEFTPSGASFNNNKTGAVRKEYTKKHNEHGRFTNRPNNKSSDKSEAEPQAGRRYSNKKYYQPPNPNDDDPSLEANVKGENSEQRAYSPEHRGKYPPNSRYDNPKASKYYSDNHEGASGVSRGARGNTSYNYNNQQQKKKYFGSGRTMHSFRDDKEQTAPNTAYFKNQFKNGRGGGGTNYSQRGNDRYGRNDGNSRSTDTRGTDRNSNQGNKENWRSRSDVPEKDLRRAEMIDERRKHLNKKDVHSPTPPNTSSPRPSLTHSTSAMSDSSSTSAASSSATGSTATSAAVITTTLTAGSHRERLEEQLRRRVLECLVCCERLLDSEAVWSCGQCYHILHLTCIREWARSSKLDNGWRCPACQNVVLDVPKQYFCFCGKQPNPPHSPGLLPHACSDSCSRVSSSTNPPLCTHPCTLPCHPGPCPECERPVTRPCGCGATAPTVKCSSRLAIVCKAVCNKMLNCGEHKCAEKCHVGECKQCAEVVRQECHCGKQGRKLTCTTETYGTTAYCCPDTCGRALACGNHTCAEPCHPGDCPPCPRTPNLVTRCPCNQTALVEKRESCLDPIPCCDKICGRPMACGQPNSPHCCQSVCHIGACPPCDLTTMVRCRCGHMDQEMKCNELTTRADDARCKKKCTKKRQCCKHNCNQLCCIESEHPCPLPCSRMLGCGNHRCPLLCHRGVCPRCDRMTFDELTCECGAQVLFPPIACGTRPPPCQRVCSRGRVCGHDPLHSCHSGECPPCTVLTRRLCHGGHEYRPAIPCHTDTFSCGMACGKPMDCGNHKCIQVCHSGDCPRPCTQPCQQPRPVCGHPCAKPCHPDAPTCPTSICRLQVTVTCECGHRTAQRSCEDLTVEYERLAMIQTAAKVAEQMRNAQGGGAGGSASVVVKDGDSGGREGNNGRKSIKILECTEECKVFERNRRLAIGLQIRNPDLSSKLTPRYNESLKDWARKNGPFVNNVHRKLSELVELAQQSKQRSRQYSFEVMNRPRRQFVHEYSDHFGCETHSYDAEPNRNVIATAYRDKSWLPSYSLMEIVQRESGQRKVTGPVLGAAPAAASGTFVKLGGRSTTQQAPSQSQPAANIPDATAASGPVIDYFNYEGPTNPS